MVIDKVILLHDVEKDENGQSNGMNIGKQWFRYFHLNSNEQMNSTSKEDEI